MMNDRSDKAVHLGDGAYASVTAEGDLCISANHHDPAYASDAVYIDRDGYAKLLNFLRRYENHEG